MQFGVDLRGSDALETDLRRLGDTPVVAITGARTWTAGGLPPRLGRAQQRLWRVMHAELAGLSTERVHVLALRSDHFVMAAQPEVVVDGVTAIVRAVRDKTQLPPCERVFTGSDVRCVS